MYNIPGLTKTLQLSSYSACAILTGGITNWDDPASPRTTRGHPAEPGHPAGHRERLGRHQLRARGVVHRRAAGALGGVRQSREQPVRRSDRRRGHQRHSPNSNWPGLPSGLDQQSTSGVAGNIATNPGAIGAVQVKYATDLGFRTDQPRQRRGLGAERQRQVHPADPGRCGLGAGLCHPTANGTHQLNFNGVGPNVYNPSTYSYLLTKTTGRDPAKGAVLSGFVNYALTLGQEAVPVVRLRLPGLSLEQYGIKAVLADVPGAVAVTAAENKALRLR